MAAIAIAKVPPALYRPTVVPRYHPLSRPTASLAMTEAKPMLATLPRGRLELPSGHNPVRVSPCALREACP